MTKRQTTTTAQAAAPSLTPDMATIQAAYWAVSSAHSCASIAEDNFTKLAAVFAAIKRFAEPHHVMSDLAALGCYLCDDWSALHGEEAEEAKRHLDTLRGMLGTPGDPGGRIHE